MSLGELASRLHLATHPSGAAWRLVCLALAVSAQPLGAQLVRGRALASADSTPIAGVVVQLTSQFGGRPNVVVAQTLSDARGAFTLRAPSEGEFRLRALRIGFRPTLGEPFQLATTGITERSIVLTGAAVTLVAERVTANERCAAGSDPSSLGFRAWEQARTALAASLVTRQTATYDMHFVVSELQRDARSDSVLQYNEKEQATSAMRPFAAMPIARLRDSGYVTRERDVVTYAAPDEEVLLSEEFAVTHCIRARPSTGDELVLTFEPTPDRKLSDVTGSLVVSRATGELRRLAYEYANVSREERAAHAGGELEFLRFPSGGWMVQRWVVRAPGFEVQSQRSSYGGAHSVWPLAERRPVVTRLHETRGEAFRVQQNGALVWAAPTVSVSGIVVDDSTGLPVEGADVRIAGRSSGARSDTRGRFRLDSARLGDILLQITAPWAIQLGVPPTKRHVATDARGADLSVRVGNPDQAIVDACRAASQPLTERMPRTIVRGIVRDAHGGRASITEISATWLHGGVGAANEMRERKARSTAFGDYVVCGVEIGTQILVRAMVGSEVVASARARIVPDMPWVVLDLLPSAAP